jgi:predicted HAD superfamily Cof-like phosphohydrolase
MFKRLWNAIRVLRGLDPELEDVRAMHLKFGILSFEEPGFLTKRKMRERLQCLREEVDELEDAVESDDIAGMTDALIDIGVFLKGTAVMLGLRRVWRRSWAEVDRANMSKIRGVGHRGHAVDLIKPPGWSPPSHLVHLHAEGLDRSTYVNRRDDAGAPKEATP